MKIERAIAAVLFAVLLSNLVAAAEEYQPVIPGVDDKYYEPTVVIINSNKWQDAYLVAVFANLNYLPVRFIQDPFQTGDFMHELSSHRFTKAIVFSRKDSTVPSLNYLLHAQNIDVRETVFEDHHDLSAKILERLPEKKVIVVRDDFAFDALTAKFLAQELHAPVIFSKGAEEMDGRVMQALEGVGPSEVYLVGRESLKLEERLGRYNLVKLQGRDELDTNNIVNEYLMEGKKLNQAVITSGDIFELLLMNVKEQPIFLVPNFGTYSLVRTGAMVTDSEMKVLLGLGQFISEAGSWLNQRTGVRVMVKFGTVSTRGQEGGMVKKDISIELNGYQLPTPLYTGKVVEVNPVYAEPLGPSTGALIAGKEVPPVEFRNVFENSGNIDYPAYIILEVRDETNAIIATLQSETQMVYPDRPNIFIIPWENPPAEGVYKVQARAFGEVYEGINFAGKDVEFDLRWLFVFINILLVLLAVLMLALAVYSSHMLSRDIRHYGGIYQKAIGELDHLIKYVNNLYHFRGRRHK